MKVSFVAGFGPIVPEPDASRSFWSDGLGIQLEEAAPWGRQMATISTRLTVTAQAEPIS